jgi:thiol-disulfide isomerase/thioredoxin
MTYDIFLLIMLTAIAISCLTIGLAITESAVPAASHGSEVDVQLASANQIKALHDTSGKPRLVNFWATWCAPCKEEFPELVSLFHRFEPKGLEFVTVSADDEGNRDQVLKFLQKNQASGRNLLFDGRDTAGMLESFDRKWKQILPYTVLFDGRGKVVFRREGEVDPSELEKALEKILGTD